MHLSRVSIKNFRCFKGLEVDLQPGLNVLVGRNNVGKTSLLNAIRHGLGSAAARGDALWLDEDDFYRDPSGSTSPSLAIELTFSGLSEAQRAFFYEILQFNHTDMAESPAVIRCNATWHSAKRRAAVRRTGGVEGPDSPDVSADILSALFITFLPALRDAEASLAPGPRSRLAVMLSDMAAKHQGGTAQGDIEDIFKTANAELEKQPLIVTTQESLQKSTRHMAGSDYAASAIMATDVEFKRILRSLQVRMEGMALGSLDSNGLGYNNLLYMAVVLEHLRQPAPDECPILMVEEPEAHLHPQLTALLAEYLSSKTPGASAPQTLVSTHSPTLVASVPPERVHLLFCDPTTAVPRCNSLGRVGLSPRESSAVQRMMDVTRASMYFAKGLILVEGICEALLVPALAKRIGENLSENHVAVIPICGVAFETLKKLLGGVAFGVPTAIVTDADPLVEPGQTWREDTPRRSGTRFDLSARTTKLLSAFVGHSSVEVFHSQLTLEYDLAEAGDTNAAHVTAAWEDCFDGSPSTLNHEILQKAGSTREQRAMAVWRGVCRASSVGSKAELAQRLAAQLSDESQCVGFEVPPYLANAIRHVVPARAPAGILSSSSIDASAHS